MWHVRICVKYNHNNIMIVTLIFQSVLHVQYTGMICSIITIKNTCSSVTTTLYIIPKSYIIMYMYIYYVIIFYCSLVIKNPLLYCTTTVSLIAKSLWENVFRHIPMECKLT